MALHHPSDQSEVLQQANPLNRHDTGTRNAGSATAATLLGDTTRENQDATARLRQEIDRRIESERKLVESQQRARLIVDSSHDAFFSMDAKGLVLDWNKQAENTFGWTRDEAIGQEVTVLLVPLCSREKHRAGVRRFGLTGNAPVVNRRVEVPAVRKDGSIIPIELSISSLCENGLYIANVFARDVSERKNAEHLVEESRKRLQAIADHLPGLVSYMDNDERIVFANATFEEWLGVVPSEVIGKRLDQIIDSKAYAASAPYIRRALSGETVRFDVDTDARGICYHLQATYVPQRDSDGAVSGIYALTTDISSLKKIQLELEKLARNDSLTGLPNRLSFDEKLHQALARGRRDQCPAVLMYLDVDYFKTINDTWGHGVGDELLKQFAARLQATVRTNDTVARLAGDEFAIILEGLFLANEAGAVADKLVATIAPPFEIMGQRLLVTTSIGIAVQHPGNVSDTDLLQRADQALYYAKNTGRDKWHVAS
ncbi:MAG: hypothetical protein NVSMB6_21770 [Burkholderiaceae bacterium]